MTQKNNLSSQSQTAAMALTDAQQDVLIYRDLHSPQVEFGTAELKEALSGRGLSPVLLPLARFNGGAAASSRIVLINTGSAAGAALAKDLKVETLDALKAEGFIVHRSGEQGKTICIIAQDDAGLMYGGFEVAEIIRVQGIDAVQNQAQNPHMKVRGVKFNIPLDVRTPTYTEPCEAAQKTMAEVWDFAFWKEYIDHLARDRYNLISLWNMHPFPSMVKVPEYPEVALDDVRRSTCRWKENYSLHGRFFDAPEIVDNYEVLKEITIDQKIAFWRKVMAYGKERNIRFYMVTWNIFDYGVEGKYGITDKMDNPITTDYFRTSVKQMILTYPDLAGIGLTTGENMYAHTSTEKEEWAFATYGQGTLDAVKEQPDRKITFIHRQHETGAKEIKGLFKEVIQNENIDFVFSYKYALAHVYSSTRQTYHPDFVKEIQSEGLTTLWTLRNDDIFQFRWGAPDFVREFIKNIPMEVSEGYYYGSDHYVWGREFLTKNSPLPRELELVKHWYHWMCWGRLGYNPEMSNERFTGIVQKRFPEVKGAELFEAWQNASLIYPLVTGYHWGALDFQWYIESSQSRPWPAGTPTGYHDVNRFISLGTHPGTDNIPIPEYTKAFLNGEPMEGTTPLQLADKVNAHADRALAWADAQAIDLPRELRITIDDIQTIAYMGKYYAHKIRGATYLALFREAFERKWHEKMVEELNTSAAYFRRFASMALSNNHNPLWTNRVGHVDWRKTFDFVWFDIVAQGGEVNLPSMDSTPGGTILKAEDAESSVSILQTAIKGYTGKGYLKPKGDNAYPEVKWTFNAPEAGDYTLEFRYTVVQQNSFPTPLLINGRDVGEIRFWYTGNAGAWVWDRFTVTLRKGENTIEIAPIGRVLLDHLNVLKR